ncbi:hypothetical protein PENSPDRAFT_753339 [Peniophora sp. CONT]|nr:hypothetical protein PENSPDRAFT_753339 [Peniophora sp. CONT]
MGPSCEMTSGSGLDINRWNILVSSITDVGLIASLFLGLSRRWSDVRTSGSGIWYILWNQNAIYFALAIALEIPMTAFYFFKSNESVVLLFTVPDTMILSIAATRFYRSLTGFSGNSSSYGYESTVVRIPQRPKPRATNFHRMAALSPSDLERDNEDGMYSGEIRLRDLSVSESRGTA